MTKRSASLLPIAAQPEIPQEASSDSPFVSIQKLIFEEAASIDASDIHIEPTSSATRLRYRVDGILKESLEIPEIPRWMHENLVCRIKILARLDISERRLPQDGHIQADDANGMDLRVSVLPTRWGEKVVIRMLRRGRSLMSLARLGFGPDTEERLAALVRSPQGMLLSVGPTGSGKTTTLYALINEIRQEPLNIVTIEDPVEYEVDRITQVQVNDKVGLTFAKTLRSILRQDPDVILVGEIRDADTARTAFHAAMTGHLVLSTLHATDAVSALLRIHELGVDRSTVAGALIGIVGQRLVRLNCPVCLEPESPRPIYLKRLGISAEHQSQFRRSTGCPKCKLSGSSGRLGLFEVLEVRGAVREAIDSGTKSGIATAARDSGMVRMTDQAVQFVLDGKLSVTEAFRTFYFGGD